MSFSATNFIERSDGKLNISMLHHILRYGRPYGLLKGLGSHTYLVKNGYQLPLNDDGYEPWAMDDPSTPNNSNVIILYYQGLPLMEFCHNGNMIIYMLNGHWDEAQANRIQRFTKNHGVNAFGARSSSGSSRLEFPGKTITPSDISRAGATGVFYNILRDVITPELFFEAPPRAVFGSDFKKVHGYYGTPQPSRASDLDEWARDMQETWEYYEGEFCPSHSISNTYNVPWFIHNIMSPVHARKPNPDLFSKVRAYVERMRYSVEEEGGLFAAILPPEMIRTTFTHLARRWLAKIVLTDFFPKQLYDSATRKYPISYAMRGDPARRQGGDPSHRTPGDPFDALESKPMEEAERVEFTQAMERGLCNLLLIDHPDFPEDSVIPEGAEVITEDLDISTLNSFRIESVTETSTIITFVDED